MHRISSIPDFSYYNVHPIISFLLQKKNNLPKSLCPKIKLLVYRAARGNEGTKCVSFVQEIPIKFQIRMKNSPETY